MNRLCLFWILLGFVALSKQVDYYNDDPDEEDEREEEEAAKTYHINSKGQHFTVTIGSPLTLPCAISEPGGVAQWRRENEALWLGTTQQTRNERLLRQDDNSLLIKNVQQADVGNYSCQLLQEPPYNEIINHYVHVYAAPRIVRTVPVDRTTVVSAGSPFTLMCEAHGHPKPEIAWTTEVKEVKIDRESVRIDKLSGKQTGNYTCTATNSQGTDSRTLEIIVKYAPIITVEKETVNSGTGYESELRCNVDAYPKAEVTWAKVGSTKKLTSHRIRDTVDNDDNVLRISSTKTDDFGNYTCTSVNEKGSTSKSIVLTGLPLTPLFVKSEVSDAGVTELTWTTESREPVLEYEILYKKQEVSNWTTEMIKADGGNNDSSVLQLTHPFADLDTATYQAVIRARNKFGWSPLSQQKTFSGPQKDDKMVGQQSGNREPLPGSGTTTQQSCITLALAVPVYLLSSHC